MVIAKFFMRLKFVVYRYNNFAVCHMDLEARNHMSSLSFKQIETSRITGDTHEPLTLH